MKIKNWLRFILIIKNKFIIERSFILILHINSCARNDSRTKKLADALLKKLKTNEKIEEINLYEENLKPLTEEKLLKRQELINKKKIFG